jgi:electron transfer flavoprotein alpha subunit
MAIAGNYSHIPFPATASGKNAAPRVAARLDVAQISDVARVVSGNTFERPIYAGNVVATVQSDDSVKVVTVRTTGFDAAAARLKLWRPWPTPARAALWAVKSRRATAPN